MMRTAALLALVASIVASGGDGVLEVTNENFDELMASDEVWLVEFSSEMCGTCQGKLDGAR